MNEYVGKICPYCKTTILENDDIVVCSACDMPHHKECWVENQGCTTFGCTGTIRNADGSVTSVTATQMQYDAPATFCRSCGAQVSGAFCTACGTPVSAAPAPQPAPQPVYQPRPVYQAPQPAYQQPPAQPVYQAPRPVYQQPAQPTYQQPQPTYQAPQPAYQQPQPTYQPPQPAYQQPQPTYQPPQPAYQQPQANPYQAQNAQVDPCVDALIGTKKEYYIPKFCEMAANNTKVSWNWASFLFGACWMFYRKMYAYGAIGIGINLILSLLPLGSLNSILILAAWVLYGIFGNFIYKTHLESKAEELRPLVEPARSQFLNQNSGTSTGAAVLAAVAAGLVGVLLGV